MDRICSFIKSQWKNVLIIILFVSHIFKVFSLSIITFCDKHEGFITAIVGLCTIVVGLVTVIIAYIALQSWRNEFKAQKTYKVHQEACEFLFNFKVFLRCLYLDYLDELDIKDKNIYFIRKEINNLFEDYGKANLKEFQKIQLSLSQINKENTVIKQIVDLFEQYYMRYSDRPNCTTQVIISECTNNEIEMDSDINNFCKDYFFLKKGDLSNPKYEKLKIDIDNGLKIFEQEIQDFFK